jgi:hypothetical protein
VSVCDKQQDMVLQVVCLPTWTRVSDILCCIRCHVCSHATRLAGTHAEHSLVCMIGECCSCSGCGFKRCAHTQYKKHGHT